MNKLLNHFSLTQKFMILGLIAFVLVSALTYLLVSSADEGIDFVRQEIKGSESIVPVMSLLQTVQQHRGMSSLVLSGENEVIPSWDAKRKEIDQAVESIDAVNKRFPELNLSNNWYTVKGQWQKLKTDVAELSPQESFHRHTALAESITRFVSLIADNSNITYDPTVEGYEIGQIALVNMPMSTEFLGRMRAWGAVLLGQKKASGDERARMDIYAGLAQQEFEKLNLTLDKIYAVNPELKSVFKASRQEMESKVKEALKLVNEQIVNSKKFDYPSQQYVATITSAIDAQFAFICVVDEQLQISLNAQANRLATKKYTILIIVVLLFALCVAVATLMVRGILIQVRSVAEALESIAQGDLSVNVPETKGRDELTAMQRSLRTMLDALFRFSIARKQAEEEIRQFNVNLERRVLERTADLAAANQELEAFSYSVSHDLRAPLRSIDGFSQAVLEDYADKLDDQGRDYLNRVRAATQRMGHLIDDLIKLARVARAEMHRESVDLSALAAEVLAELQKGEPARQVDCRIEPGLVASGDARLLRLALVNLLGNAWKYTGCQPQPRIEFGALHNAQGATDFFVRDNGAGFDMAYADKLFGAFQRLHLQGEFPGTGVGLATVQRIIHRHGGQVRGEGVPGQGATFYFTLPA